MCEQGFSSVATGRTKATEQQVIIDALALTHTLANSRTQVTKVNMQRKTEKDTDAQHSHHKHKKRCVNF